jgi:hypothetical protein
MDTTANTNKMQYFTPKFQDILRSSQILMMNQVADIIEDKKFDHVSFLGKTPVSDVIANLFPMASQTNNVIQDKYTQLFVTRKIFEENYDIFASETSGGNYVVVDDYSQVFAGLVRCDQYFILANSSEIINKFPVYTLIDSLEQANITVNSQDKKFEFYGLVRLGYLINPRGYTQQELEHFEQTMGFELKPEIKSYVSNTSILKFENRLFHINLDPSTYSADRLTSLGQKFAYPGEKTISNIKFLARYKSASPGIEYNQVIADEAEYIRSLLNGFLYVGSLKKQMLLINDQVYLKSDKKVLLLLNYDPVTNTNYKFSVWTHTYDNKNFDKILDYYDDRENPNKEKNDEEEEEPEFDANIHLKPDNIFQTLKCVSNLFFD